MVKGGNAVNGSGGSSGANPVMKVAAREKTWLKVKGASKGCGNGDWWRCARIKAEWRASMVRMLPAAVRNLFSRIDAAAPR